MSSLLVSHNVDVVDLQHKITDTTSVTIIVHDAEIEERKYRYQLNVCVNMH